MMESFELIITPEDNQALNDLAEFILENDFENKDFVKDLKFHAAEKQFFGSGEDTIKSIHFDIEFRTPLRSETEEFDQMLGLIQKFATELEIKIDILDERSKNHRH